MTTPKQTAIKNLLAHPVGKAAAGPVIQAIKQQMAQNLPAKPTRDLILVNYSTKFFPHQRPTTLSNLIPSYTGMGPADWVEFVTAVLCQAIYYWSGQSSRLNATLIDKSVDDYGRRIFKTIGSLGAKAISLDVNIAALAKAAQDTGATKADLINEIINIMPSRILLYNDKQWLNGDLEIFDWIGKYLAMGGSESEIPQLFKQFYDHGMPQFPNMTGAGFPGYTGYIDRPIGPSYRDFPEIKSTVTYSTRYCSDMGVCMNSPDQWSDYFIRGSEAAKKYLSDQSCCGEDTEVLMADGSSKLISTLSNGDKILGSSGSTTVQFISKTPLSGRHLYELFAPGEGPRLTDAHPIANPHRSADSDEPHTLAIDPTLLKQILPNHCRTGVGGVTPHQTKVNVINTNTGENISPTTETVQAIRETDTSDHGEMVYDIVLPFSVTDRVGYWAGRNGKYVLIEPELMRLEDDPFVAAAILEMLSGLAQSHMEGKWEIRKDDSDRGIRAYFKTYGMQIFKLAFQQALTVATHDISVPHGVDDISMAIDNFINHGSSNSPSLLADIADILESCTKHMYVPLSNVIRNGWRQFPQERLRKDMLEEYEGHPPADHLVVTLLDIEIIDCNALDDASLIILDSVLCSSVSHDHKAVGQMATTTEETNNPHRHILDHAIVYDMPSADCKPSLDISLAVVDGGPIVGTGQIQLYADAYTHRHLFVFDEADHAIAKINFDVRNTSQEQIKTEASVTDSTWSDQDKLGYAVSLGREMVSTVTDALAKRQEVMTKKPMHILEV